MNNNKIEYNFLNNNTQQKEKKNYKNIFLSIAIVISWILYIIIYFICGFIVIIASLLFGISLKPHKHKKRWF